MLIIYLIFFPVIGLLFAILHLRRKSSSSWLLDSNALEPVRSILFGKRGANKAFFQQKDVTCYHTSSATMTSTANKTTTTTAAASSLGKSTKSSGSRLKTTLVDWLPAENFTFHESSSSETAFEDGEKVERPLLILFAWLFAQERHLDKYRILYMERGFDVLTIKVNVWDFLIPQSGSQKIAAYIVRFMIEHRHRYRAYIFHAFSVGAYQMGELFVCLGKEINKQTQGETRNMLKGIVYDSALDIDEAPLGLSKATTNNSVLQWAIMTLMNAHLRLCYHIATRHYISSSQEIRANKFGCPTLVFLSKDDEVANYEHQFEIIDQWRQDGVPVTTVCWDQSPHVSHFFKHPDEYRSFLDDFLKNTAKIV